MRVLTSTTRGAGHLGPLLPFARALLRNNDDVMVTVVTAGAREVEEAGLDVWPLPDPPAGRRDEIFAAARGLSEQESTRLVMRDVFARIDARHVLPGVIGAIELWRPDVVLYETTEFAAPLAAERLGVPAVRVAIAAAAVEAFVFDVAAPAIDELRVESGLPADPPGERLRAAPSFTLAPPAFDGADGTGRLQRFRETRAGNDRPLPDLWRGNDWPLVYLTLGSVAPTMDYFPGLYRAAAEALAVLPARVLVTVGRDRDPAALGELPPNVHVARWIPHADVLPHAAAMVCHGGSGTVRGGLVAGVPMAVMPLFADQPFNARRVEEIGAGIAVDPGEVAGLPGVVRRLLGEPGYRETARRVANEVETLPPVEAAIGALEELVGYNQPRSVAWSTA
jgi:UDP:flavonoid glycosyltransferase YjiC (YdhE family)